MNYDEKIKELNALEKQCNGIDQAINENLVWSANNPGSLDPHAGDLKSTDESWVRLYSDFKTYFRINPDPEFEDRLEKIKCTAPMISGDIIDSVKILINDIKNELKVRENIGKDENTTNKNPDLAKLHSLIAQMENVKNNPMIQSLGRKSSLLANMGESLDINDKSYSCTKEFVRWSDNLKLYLSMCSISDSAQVKEIIELLGSFRGLGEEDKLNKLEAKMQALEQNYETIEDAIKMKGKQMNKGNKVFIVHGHDEFWMLKVKDFVRDLGLKPVILKEQPSHGLPIILKLDENTDTDVVFAIVLYTACDIGRDKTKGDEESKPRARQNVVFEHGLLYGKLERGRVVALLESGVEKPSDIEGIEYIPMDDGNLWKFSLVREMNGCGLNVSIN